MRVAIPFAPLARFSRPPCPVALMDAPTGGRAGLKSHRSSVFSRLRGRDLAALLNRGSPAILGARLRRRGNLLAFSDMSQVIYARVPEAVKSDVEEYADRQGVSLSSAAVDLLQRGLAAAGEERSIVNLEGKLARISGEKATLDAKLQVATSEAGALRSFVQRAAATTVGSCPSCHSPITGLDLLGQGRCGKCQTSLLELLAPKSRLPQPLLDDRAIGALVGGLGIVLIAAAVLGSKGA